MFRYIITPLLICCLTAHAAADDVQLQPNHPDRHIVVKGDTLWDISAKFLKNPWAWPKVWQMNRAQIKNPHLIYPGDVVFLDMSSGKPQLRLLRETVTLQPGVREEPLGKEAIPSISPSIITPFLSRPLVVETDQLNDSPYIISGQDNRVILSPGSRIYINKLEEDAGLVWNVYRPGKSLVDPDSKEVLGVEAIYLGDARITKYGEPASATVVTAKEEIFAKDKLVLAPETVEFSYVPHAPDTDIQGRVISITGGLAETGRNSIIAINKGTDDGIEVGHVLAINRQGRLIKNPNAPKPKGAWAEFKDSMKVDPSRRLLNTAQDPKEAKAEAEKEEKSGDFMRLPNERVGLVMIFRTFNRVSYGLIMQATEPVRVLDVVEKP